MTGGHETQAPGADSTRGRAGSVEAELRARLQAQGAILEHQRAVIEGHAAVVEAQATMIEDLQRRLAALETLATATASTQLIDVPAANLATTPTHPSGEGAGPDPDATNDDPTTSRRHLFTRGAAAAASVVAGTAAVSALTASPAAAAQGVFDGNPAVIANATNANTAILASSQTGVVVRAVQGQESSTPVLEARGINFDGPTLLAENGRFDGIAIAVTGRSTSPFGTGVEGIATHTTGYTYGLRGEANSPNGTGVVGTNDAQTGTGSGVRGSTSCELGSGVTGSHAVGAGAGYGVWGWSSSPVGTGVYAFASSLTGASRALLARSSSSEGTAIVAEAESGGVGIVSTSDRTQLRFAGAPAAPPSTGVARQKGELVFDADGDLWLCTAAGTPGTWRRVSGTSTAGAFTILPATIRIYDSRPGTQPPGVARGQLGNMAERVIDAKTGNAVPAGATAVLVNLTIVNTGAPGYLALYKNGIAYPGNSTINWNQPNTLLANSAVVALDDQARFKVKANIGFTDFVIDAIGYYR